MRFGLSPVRKTTGAELSVCAFQLFSLLPALFIVIESVYKALFTQGGIVGFLCSLGYCGIPRWEALGLSFLYRLTRSEPVVCIVLLVTALAVGVAAKKLLRAGEKTAFTARIVFAALLGADLILRLLPFSFNGAFPFAASACGFVLTLARLALVTADIAVYKKERKTAGAPAA